MIPKYKQTFFVIIILTVLGSTNAIGQSARFNELANLGVKRVSLGSALARAALGAFQRAAIELSKGSYNFVNEAVPYLELNKIFEK